MRRRRRAARATRAELDALVAHAARLLPGWLGDDADGERRRVHLRRLLAAAGLEPPDVRALHGLCAALER